MITNIEHIAQVFSIFHDGSIALEEVTLTYQCWKIDCQYLAEMLQPEYNYFFVKLYGLTLLEFHPWNNDLEAPLAIWASPQQIFRDDIEILSTVVEEDKVKIYGNLSTSDHYSGGELCINCQGLTIADETQQLLTLSDLKQIATNYWTKTF